MEVEESATVTLVAQRSRKFAAPTPKPVSRPRAYAAGPLPCTSYPCLFCARQVKEATEMPARAPCLHHHPVRATRGVNVAWPTHQQPYTAIPQARQQTRALPQHRHLPCISYAWLFCARQWTSKTQLKCQRVTLLAPSSRGRNTRVNVAWPTHQQPYEDRRHAGVELAARLRDLKGRPDVVVLALPRGVSPSRTKSLEPSTHRSISSLF